jgi:hypothetical protein
MNECVALTPPCICVCVRARARVCRDSFVLVGGSGTVVAHAEGGASYANYFKYKAPDRIRLLQMRSKRPYLFTGE